MFVFCSVCVVIAVIPTVVLANRLFIISFCVSFSFNIASNNDNRIIEFSVDKLKEVYAYEDGAMVVGNYSEDGYWMLRKDNIDGEN